MLGETDRKERKSWQVKRGILRERHLRERGWGRERDLKRESEKMRDGKEKKMDTEKER